MGTATKSQKLAAMKRIEQQLRAKAADQSNACIRAAYEVAAGSLHINAIRVEHVADEAEAARLLDAGLVETVKALGRVTKGNAQAAAEVGYIPMLIATEVCSET